MTAVLVGDLVAFEAREVQAKGVLVARDGRALVEQVPARLDNRFDAEPIDAAALRIEARGGRARVIVARDGELYTDEELRPARVEQGCVRAEPQADVLLLAALNRYQLRARPALALVRCCGLQRGALASSVAHDSHNVLCVGVDEASVARAMNAVIASKGGLAVVDGERIDLLPLPIAGLMSDLPGDVVAARYAELDRAALVARYGGEEFACLMVDADRETTLRVAERMRALVEALPPRTLGNDDYSVTLSGGALNAIPQSGEQASDLLRRADAALYAAKHAGRNRVLAAD